MSVRDQVIEGNFAGHVVVSLSWACQTYMPNTHVKHTLMSSPHHNTRNHPLSSLPNYGMYCYTYSGPNSTQQQKRRIKQESAGSSVSGQGLGQRKRAWRHMVISLLALSKLEEVVPLNVSKHVTCHLIPFAYSQPRHQFIT